MTKLCLLGFVIYIAFGASLFGFANGKSGYVQPNTQCESPKVCIERDQCTDETPVNTDGSGIIQFRTKSVNLCTPSQICCNTPKNISLFNNKCGVDMECITPTLCSSTGHIITDGVALISLRQAIRKDKPKCHWSEVCCALENKKPQPVKEYVSRGCGYSNPKGIGIAVTDTDNGESNFAEFPWVVMILANKCTKETCVVEQVAAGSLLTPNVVITATHRINHFETSVLTVRAGEWETESSSEPKAHENRNVKKKIIHEDYGSQTAINGVALLILESPFKLAEHIDTICFAENRYILNNERCLVMGWGKKKLNDPNYPHILKKIDLPFVGKPCCQEQLRRTALGPRFRLHESFVCAGGEKDKDACFGDGGAPLVCPLRGEANRYQLAGIVAWGMGCGQENVPGVYVDVQFLRPWILQKLRENNIYY